MRRRSSSRPPVLELELDAVAVGELLHRVAEVEALLLLQEGEDVAAGLAAEAVIELLAASTENEGVRSSWNGHRPSQRVPRRRSSVCAETTSTMSAACRTRSIDSAVTRLT